MSAAPARFTFDLDLRHPPGTGPAQDARLEAIASDARAEGFAEGLAEAERSSASRLAAAADSLARSVAQMEQALETARSETLATAVDLAASIARKLAGGLMASQPQAELEALVGECLATISSVPHLVVRCHPDLADTIRTATDARIVASGFSGKLVVIADPEIAVGDGRIEWADGGIVRDSAAITAAVDTAIANYLAAHGVTGTKETSR